jgi:hypothetical protein
MGTNLEVNSLAMAEMTTLLAAVYKNYNTKIQARQDGISPGVTSRFEIFSDETFPEVGVRLATVLDDFFSVLANLI